MVDKVAPTGVKAVIINTSTKMKEKAQEAKEKWDNLDTKEKAGVIAGGVVVLGGIVYTAYRLAKGKKVELPQEPAKKPFVPIQNQIDVQHTPKAQRIQEAIKEGNERADKAIKQYEQGGNYKKLRKEAKLNLDKEGKKAAQAKLNEAHSKKVAAEIAAQHANSNNVFNTINSNKAIKNANQGMNSAVSSAEIDARVYSAKAAAANAQKAADEVKEVAGKKPTSQNIKRAKVAQNQANEAARQAQVVEDNAAKAKRALGEEIGAKRENRQAELNSKGYQTGTEKKAKNKQINQANAIKREIDDLRSLQKYKRTVADFKRRRFSKEKLEKIINNPKSSEIEKFAAKEVLAKLASK